MEETGVVIEETEDQIVVRKENGRLAIWTRVATEPYVEPEYTELYLRLTVKPEDIPMVRQVLFYDQSGMAWIRKISHGTLEDC
jgi:hypothetical protein